MFLIFVVLKSYNIYWKFWISIECIWIQSPDALPQLLLHPFSPPQPQTTNSCLFKIICCLIFMSVGALMERRLPTRSHTLNRMTLPFPDFINCQCSHYGSVMEKCLILCRYHAGGQLLWTFLSVLFLHCQEDNFFCLALFSLCFLQCLYSPFPW